MLPEVALPAAIVTSPLSAWYVALMGTSLRATRAALLEDASLKGDAFCTTFSNAADAWLAELASAATSGDTRHLALVAVGGYGRASLCPYSDLDLVLIHDGRGDVTSVADKIWYPVWDEGVSLDHSVRSPKEVLQLAGQDLRVALGLLDGRLIWGDPKVAGSVLDDIGSLWRSKLGAYWLNTLAAQMAERHDVQGDVAFLLEPNLKEGHGGLRDVNVLRAISQCAPGLQEFVDIEALVPPTTLLTSVRVELHRQAKREQDKLLLQEQDHVAEALGYPDADELMRAVSEAGRTIARLSDDTWRRRRMWQPEDQQRGLFKRRTKTMEQEVEAPVMAETGIVVLHGEVALTSDAEVRTDPTLAFRLAAVAAERDLPIALGSVHRLADQMGEVSTPWPPALLASFVRVLQAGPAATVALESLDQRELITRFLPEWSAVRFHHQRNAYHRFTTDRHLLEATANASAIADRVDRPDLLLLGTLFHDIGKGRPGDHTEVGMALVREMAPRMGLNAADTATLVAMVELHLVLPDTAVRRDLSDPATIEKVANQVGNRERLLLLHGLTQADSQATGPAAWGTWKAGLVDELVRRTAAHFDGHDQPAIASWVTDVHRTMVEEARASDAVVVGLEPPRLAVAAPDRPGLLALVTGTLALHGLTVQSADVISDHGVALEVFTIGTDPERWPSTERFTTSLNAVLSGELVLAKALADRSERYRDAARALSARRAQPRCWPKQMARALRRCSRCGARTRSACSTS